MYWMCTYTSVPMSERQRKYQQLDARVLFCVSDLVSLGICECGFQRSGRDLEVLVV